VTRRTVVNLVTFAVVSAVFVVWAASNILTALNPFRQPYPLHAEFASASGLRPGAEVAYLGVAVGRVSEVERIPGGVRVRMDVDEGERIPEGSTAHVFRKSALGEPFVDFFPPEGVQRNGPSYREGAVVPMARTTVPLEFSELLRSASELVAAVPPEDVRVLVHELAVGLAGRAGSLRELVEAGDTLSRTLAARTEALDRLATNNTRLTRVLAEHRGALGQSLTDLRHLAETLRRAEGDTSVLLERGSRLLAQTADLVAANKANLDCDLKTLERVVDSATEPERLAGLERVLVVGPDAFARLFDSRDVDADGVWLRVGFLENRTNPAPQYVPPKDLPAPPEVPTCESPLRPAAAGVRPGPAAAPTIPATGATLALTLGLAFVAAAAVCRHALGTGGA
jgi:phospholipid/cholesterol/gamma-HCH transport system substrate-binding protein